MTKRILAFMIFGGWAIHLYAQLSPGDLTQAHADLEGMSNCTLCHDLGASVSDAKCLDCHDDIQALIDARQGYHANPTVRRQNCFDCHSEHHGRRFDMVRFDQDNFDHDLTGYELEGAHNRIDCRECHQPDNIASSDIRQRENTFLGLGQECLSCHSDYHQQTLSSDCRQCHDLEAFSPAASFDHDETDYPLTGGHTEVECIECHQQTIRNGREFQEFADIRHEDCVVCHEDPHDNRIAGACFQCHTEQSFSTFRGQRGFNHNQTQFALRGAHNTTGCFDCHDFSRDPTRVFADQNETEENNCVSCHEDQHEGRYGLQCVDCHQESDFLDLRDMSFFDHDVADYHLTGRHIGVDCRACHTGRYSEPIDFSLCRNCHEDYHQGEFEANGAVPDCESCHSLEHGFGYSLYTLEQHQQTNFPLEGAHIATPCFACHIDERTDRWTFRNLGSDCYECHQDIHEGYIEPRYYPQNSCTTCHGNEAWSSVAFDHNTTDWPLTGAHLETDCRDCHFDLAEDGSLSNQRFSTLETDCVACHENVHGEEFAVNGVTECTRCHVTASWFPDLFDHNTTRFPLEGRHGEIECRACHEIKQEDGSLEVIYQIERFECADCHS